ncbi:MAG: accessory factor UbiK family protein [Nitrosomonas sp.]|nr:accessory factor UbiK family protein [Nitrosomonas sp.]
MLNKNIIEDINSKVSEILHHSPAKDIEKNVKVLLSSAFTRLDLVSREEFDVQQEVLQRTREKLVALEAKVTALEDQLGLSQPESITKKTSDKPQKSKNKETKDN